MNQLTDTLKGVLRALLKIIAEDKKFHLVGLIGA